MNNNSPLMIPIIMNKLKKRLDIETRDMLKEYDLSKIHLMYMIALFEHEEGLTLKELSEFLGFDKANTSRAISKLVTKKYVQKEVQDGLKLKYKVELTCLGREISSSIWHQNQKANAELIQIFSAEELLCLSRIGNKLWDFLSNDKS